MHSYFETMVVIKLLLSNRLPVAGIVVSGCIVIHIVKHIKHSYIAELGTLQNRTERNFHENNA